MKISNIVTLLAVICPLANGENTISYNEENGRKCGSYQCGAYKWCPKYCRANSICRHGNCLICPDRDTGGESCGAYNNGCPKFCALGYECTYKKKYRGWFCEKSKSDKWKMSINAEEIDTSKDIPSSCLNNIYDVELRTVKDDEEAHFLLTAKSSDEKSSDDKCPEVLTFTSINEKKSTHRVQDITKFDEGSSSFLLGKASLEEIIDAERSVEAIKDSKYELTKNSCVHYAGHIWRKLQFDETNELASFLIENLLKDDGFLKVARSKLSAGGLRVMSYVAGKGSLKDFVKDTVYSQLNIKEHGENHEMNELMIEVTA
eukprot:scaffold45649_cov55-Cyclotella_meneghiniana.AAC.1